MSSRRARFCCGALVLAIALPGGASAQFWPGEGLKLERVLQDGALGARRAAVRRLALLSPSMARPALELAMRDEDLDVRLVASRTCRLFRLLDLKPLVHEWLKSSDAQERLEAVRFIAEDPDDDGMNALGSVIADANREVRVAATQALGQVSGKYAGRASAKLLSLLDDSEMTVRIEAAAGLGRVGSGQDALTLASHLQDPDTEVREQVAIALGAIGDVSAVPALLGGLSDPQESVVAAVAGSLGLLSTEQAVFGLLSLAEKSPQKLQARRALESLVSLPEPRVRQVVLELLPDSAYRSALSAAFGEAGPSADALLRECILKHASDVVVFCAEQLARRGGDLAVLLEAYKRGTLSTLQLLALFRGQVNDQVVVLALEQLSSNEERSRLAALGYLGSLKVLPAIADGPLQDAYGGGKWTPELTATLFSILVRVKSKDRGAFAEPLLDATDETVRAAAAELLVARGLSGKKLEALLLGPEPTSSGALQGLSHGASQHQAALVTRLLRSGTHGRRKAFLSILWAFPKDLPDAVLVSLFAEFSRARGAERDALLVPLILGGNSRMWGRVMKVASDEDQIKIAQLTWFDDRTTALATQLMSAGSPRAASLAAYSLGRHGSADDRQALLEWAQEQPGDPSGRARPSYARAAALSGLSLLARRGKMKALPSGLLSESTCKSSNIGVRAQAVRLAAALGESCAGTTLEDLVLLDPDARLRRLAALLLRDRSPDARELVRCGLYETRAEIAALCRDQSARHTAIRDPGEGMHVVRLRAAGGDAATETPAATWIEAGEIAGVSGPGFALPLFTDRRGDLLLPVRREALVDSSWYY